ncbi:hypothetical protein [Parasphingorhabdus pacifica]
MTAPGDHGGNAVRLMRTAMFMLETAVEDVAAGRYSSPELCTIADGLDLLSTELRRPQPVVVESES